MSPQMLTRQRRRGRIPPVISVYFVKEGTNHLVYLSRLSLGQNALVGSLRGSFLSRSWRQGQESDERSSGDILPSSYEVPVRSARNRNRLPTPLSLGTIRFYRSRKRDRSLYMWSVKEPPLQRRSFLLAASISSSLTSKGPASRPLTPIRSLKGPKTGESFSSLQTSVKGFRYCNSRL